MIKYCNKSFFVNKFSLSVKRGIMKDNGQMKTDKIFTTKEKHQLNEEGAHGLGEKHYHLCI